MLSKGTSEEHENDENVEESPPSYNEPSPIPSPLKKKHKVSLI